MDRWIVFRQQHNRGVTCPCASTSSRCRALPPSSPLRTYWPEAELLSLTRKSPLQVSRDSACSRPSLGHRVHRGDTDIRGGGWGWFMGLWATETVAVAPAMEPVLLNQTLEPWAPLAIAVWFHRGWWRNRGRIFCFENGCSCTTFPWYKKKSIGWPNSCAEKEKL